MGLAFLLLAAWAGTALADEHSGVLSGAEVSLGSERRVGHPVLIGFDLREYAFATGTYASINVRWEQKPDGANPMVKAGYPETVIRFDTPGTYRMTVILNEVSKPSCGGVDAKLLLERAFDLIVIE